MLKHSVFFFFILLRTSIGFTQTLEQKVININPNKLAGKSFSIPEQTSLNIHFKLSNTLTKDTLIILEVGREELAQLFEYTNGERSLLSQTGIRVPIPERSVKNNLNILEIKLNPLETKNLSLNIDNYAKNTKTIKPKFWEEGDYKVYEAKLKETFYYKYWLPAFFLILTLALLLAIIQYFILPERVFIYYFLYVVFTLIRSASAIEIFRFEEWIPILNKFGYRSMQSQVFTYLSFIFYLLFVRDFTDLPNKKPKIDTFFKLQIGYLALFILFDLFFTSTKYTNPGINGIFRNLETLGLVFGIITTILLLKLYNRINKYIIFGVFSLLLIAFLGQEILKRSLGTNKESEFNTNLLSIIWGIAYIVEIGFFIAALVVRQKSLLNNIYVKQRENELLEQQLTNKNTETYTDFQTFSLSTNQGVHVFQQLNIVRLEGSGNYTLFFLQDQKQIMASYTLAEFESKLDPALFVRVHKSHLVNLKYIVKYTKGDGGTITLHDGTEIPVSRSRKEDFLKKLDNE